MIDWPLPPLTRNPDGSTSRAFASTPMTTIRPACVPMSPSDAAAAAKGARNGLCNRSACPNTHAIHFNATMDAYYCTPCARRINEAARQVGMQPLCDWPSEEQLGPDDLLLPEVTT